MSVYGMSDRTVLKEIGRRLKNFRLNKNISQQDLAERAGLNRTTVGDIERGAPFSMLAFVQMLRALNILDGVGTFLPESGISPLQMAKMKGKMRRRASHRKQNSDQGAQEW